MNAEFNRMVLQELGKGKSVDLLESFVYIVECYKASVIHDKPEAISFMKALQRITIRHIHGRLGITSENEHRRKLLSDLQKLEALQFD